MRIVIDLQGMQSASRHRGIGRYTMGLTRAIIKNSKNHEVILVLNGIFTETIEEIRANFSALLPQENIVVWNAPGPVAALDFHNEWRQKTAELIRESFLASLQPDVVLISSLFEGAQDNAVTSIGMSNDSIPTAVILYDLIPLLFSESYLQDPQVETWYQSKIDHLCRADLLLSISEGSRLEGLEHLQFSEESIVNISTATDGRFSHIEISANEQLAIRKRYNLFRPFVMYTGGGDHRKNNEGLIRGYASLPSEVRAQHQLLIVGSSLFPDAISSLNDKAKLYGLNKDELIIISSISDSELCFLYNLCKAFIFPSLHEGFGLPALEAMCCGRPVIGSNTSSIPEVIGRKDALFNPHDDKEITAALTKVLTDDVYRKQLEDHATRQSGLFSWDVCSKRAISELEKLCELRCNLLKGNGCGSSSITTDLNYFNYSYRYDINKLLSKIGALKNSPSDDLSWIYLSDSIAKTFQPTKRKQLLLDISELVHRDSATGIQRVVRSILYQILTEPPLGFDVSPVYATQEGGYRYARNYTNLFLKKKLPLVEDDPIDVGSSDIFIGLDLQHHVVVSQDAQYQELRSRGVKVYFVVYDLLPILFPHCWPSEHKVSECHANWLTVLSKSDGAICISKAVADEFADWLKIAGPKRVQPLNIGWFHLGADIDASNPSKGLTDDAKQVLNNLSLYPSFLIVGTLEPRKAQLQTLMAFEQLWNQGLQANLVIVGKQGWMVEALVEKLLSHPQLGKRLFWLNGISDEYLEKVYAASACLIAASEGEGFGLPLIEAAQHKLPIIARDIPVFREVAGTYAFYFSGLGADALANAVREWLTLDKINQAPQSDNMPWLTWKQSTQNLLDVMLSSQWYQQWMPDDVHRFWGGDSRLGTQVGKHIGCDIMCTGQAGYLLFGPYISLAAGQHRVTIRGAIGENGLAGAYMDVVVNKGAHIIGKSVLSTPDENGNFVALLISLDVPCTDLEVRLWVSDDTDLQVSMIEIAPWQGEDICRFWGGDSRLGTQVGKRIGCDIMCTGQAGYLLFGPYISLAAGQYRVAIHGTLGENGLAGARMDIVVDKGSIILGESVLSEPDENGNFVALHISLDVPCTDLEVRVWVTDNTELQISIIEIAPWQGEQEAAEPNQDAAEVEVVVSQQKLTDSSALVEIVSDYAQASNDASAPGVMPRPSAAQNQSQPSAKERSLAKARRKKKKR